MGRINYANEFELSLHPSMLGAPLKWKKPRTIFVNSMSDLFHEEVPVSFIQDSFEIMRRASWHQFQILTKRSQRLVELDSYIKWPANVWMGVSVENGDFASRIEDLKECSARTKFISFEPLIGPIHEPNVRFVDWVIVGGESGPHFRPIDENWVYEIRDACIGSAVPFFFKQWGGTNRKKNGETPRWPNLE